MKHHVMRNHVMGNHVRWGTAVPITLSIQCLMSYHWCTVITCILPAGKTTYINFKLGLNVREG